MKRTYGFTMVELMSAIVLLVIVSSLVLLQKSNIDASNRDKDRKTAVNAIYYGLKEGYFPQNQNYPIKVSKETLPYVDPSSFTELGNDKYDVQYHGLNCDGAKCQNFEIRVRLEKESVYKKEG